MIVLYHFLEIPPSLTTIILESIYFVAVGFRQEFIKFINTFTKKL